MHLGVRSNRTDVDDMVRAALGDYVVEGLESPPNFSVIIAGDGPGSDVAAGLHFLYKNHNAIVRSRRPGRVMEALFAYLAEHLPSSEPDGLIRVPGVGLVKDGRAVLAPSMITNWTDILAPRLNRSGVQFVDAPHVSLDIERGDLIVEEPDLRIDRTVLVALNGSRPAGSEPAPVGPGRYPVVGWALFGGEEDEIGPLSRAEGIMAVVPNVIPHSTLEPKRLLEALGQLFATAKPVSIGSAYKGDLASKLVGVFSS